MTYLTTQPQIMATAAADVEGIGSAISAARTAAAGPTSALLAPAADEVSAAITKLFGAYGNEYQAVLRQVAAFHSKFTRALAAAGNAYANAESANAATISQQVANAVTPIDADLTLIFGPTGNPNPNATYVNNANTLYIGSNKPLLGVFTPEEGYPITGVKSLTFDRSINEGLTILDNAIMANTKNGATLTVFGYSQSAIMASLEMQKLALLGSNAPAPGQLNFVLVGNEMNPNGGLLSRFPNLSIPSLGLTFYGATPPDTPYLTNIYTLEYDGFADFPQYPINLLSDLNAVAGILSVHTTYLQLTSTQVASAVELQPSPGYTGNTHYYMIPTDNLPLLSGLRAIPVVGQPLADLIQPDLKVLVDLGYGSTTQGWSPDYPNMPTQFGLSPHLPASTVLSALAAGTQQGIQDFKADLANIFTTPIVIPPLQPPPLVDVLLGPAPAPIAPTPSNIVNTVVSIISTDYAVLLPTADIGLSLVTTVPAYDASLFASELAQFHFIDAIGYPIAADVGLASVAGMIEFITVAEAAIGNIRDIASLIP
jgi:hypothetical protein